VSAAADLPPIGQRFNRLVVVSLFREWNIEDALRLPAKQRLSTEDARSIWKMHVTGHPNRAIANQFSVTESNISMIITGRSWRSVYREFTGRESDKTNRRQH